MEEVKQVLEGLDKKRLLVVMPHPDDETVMASGLLSRAMELGWQVKVVVVTNGVMGQIHVHGRGRSVVQIRKEEMAKAMEILGVGDCEMWKFCDGRLKEDTNWHSSVKDLIDRYAPGLVLSYGPSGASGHPDHLKLGEYVFELFKSSEFELWWPAFEGEVREFLEGKVKTAKRLEKADVEVELSENEAGKKRQALLAHESQPLDDPLSWLDRVQKEWFAVADKNGNYDFGLVEFDLGD